MNTTLESPRDELSSIREVQEVTQWEGSVCFTGAVATSFHSIMAKYLPSEGWVILSGVDWEFIQISPLEFQFCMRNTLSKESKVSQWDSEVSFFSGDESFDNEEIVCTTNKF